jgi:hypothetical protein
VIGAVRLGPIFYLVEGIAERSVLDKIFKIACSIFGTVPFLFGVWISGLEIFNHQGIVKK